MIQLNPEMKGDQPTISLLVARDQPIHLLDELIFLLLVLLNKMRKLGESKVVSFLGVKRIRSKE